jgi:polar amino acid transport system substrate-binding protein
VFRWLRLVFALVLAVAATASPAWADTLDDIRRRGELTWGTDQEGGAPYVQPDPTAPDGVGGFETEIGRAIAKELGVKGRPVHNAWDGLIPALERKNYDIAFNGLEVTPDRLGKVVFTRPYYVYTQQIVVRKGTVGINELRDLKGKRVGTLGATVAERLLKHIGGVDIKIYPSSVQPFDDLLLGRIDAVLQDLPIAVAYAKPKGLVLAGKPFGEGLYAIALRKEDERLKQEVDAAIGRLIDNGELRRILARYDLWNEAQAKLKAPFDQIVADSAAVPVPTNRTFLQQLRDAAPLLAKGTLMTITVSTLGMVLAMTLGIALALLRVYGTRPLAWLAAAYVEVFRGTPLLIQLFLIYYGLPNLGIQLDAFVAAVVGLGLNYAAYEAENYRAGLLAVPKGQLEAALALGMTRFQMLREVVMPQAIRIVIPPVTNDFIALFKDSSVVSVITMVELTKAYGMIASETYNYMAFGLVTAAIYFCLSYPTSLFARWLEVRLRPA